APGGKDPISRRLFLRAPPHPPALRRSRDLRGLPQPWPRPPTLPRRWPPLQPPPQDRPEAWIPRNACQALFQTALSAPRAAIRGLSYGRVAHSAPGIRERNAAPP